MQPVVRELLEEVISADAGPILSNNVDPWRFPDGYAGPAPETASLRLAGFLNASAGLQVLYDHLEPSDRKLLLRVLTFNVLGHRKVSLPMTYDRLRRLVDRAAEAKVAQRTASAGIFDWWADDFDLTALGYPIRLRVILLAVVQLFLIEQYRCSGVPEIRARPGDVVIDGGAYWGESALYFAHAVTPHGRVLSFEIDPANRAALEYNLSLNPTLRDRIVVKAGALWHQPGQTIPVHTAGPGTRIASEGETQTPTETIDSLVQRGDVDRVDFIKLDIEGAELNCLKGAEATLREFRPRLAIAAYHKPDDLAVIPAYLLELDLGYRFRLGHTTMHHEETVLFATTEG